MMRLTVLKSQVWSIYRQAAEHLPVDGLRSLSLTFYAVAERLQVDIDRRATSGEIGGAVNATIARAEVA